MAVYVDFGMLKKHDVSAKKFEAAFRATLDDVGGAIAHAMGEMMAEIFSEPSEGREKQTSHSAATPGGSLFDLTPNAFWEIVDNSRAEHWLLHADGTHTVIGELPQKRRKLRENGSALPDTNLSDGVPVQGAQSWHISALPVTLEEARATFAKDTGIAWPDSAYDIHFDERRVPLLGDGEFYVTFALPRDLLEAWIKSPPPWDAKQWKKGPVPVEIGCHCRFGSRGPSGWTAKEGAAKEYSGGSPEILKILESCEVWYVARDRAPRGNPWYNGDLLILDTRTGVVRYSSWDM